jgi:hypothetical protein
MSTRTFTVQKDGSHFRILIKANSRFSRNQKTSFVRGYATAKLANEDVERLRQHLETQYLKSFKKHAPDEMVELLEQSSKRSCRRPMKDPDPIGKIRILSGNAFNLLRRKLNLKYYLFKKDLLLTNSPIIAKETWLLREETEEEKVPNYAELDLECKCQTALAYIHQRIRVLRGRKTKNVGLMDVLRKSIYSGQCFTKIRETLHEEDSGTIDLTEAPPKYTLESTSKAQLNRVMVQCFTVLTMLQQLDLRNDSEETILRQLLSDLDSNASDVPSREVMFREHEAFKKQFRNDNSMQVLSERVRNIAGGVISSKKIREWYHEYLDKESFQEDLRGSWKREMFLEEYGYSLRFQLYLKNERKLTVDVATKALEEIIQKDPPKTEEGKKAFENLRPFSRRTVHRWMLKLGCKYEKATVSYYTDSHEAEETKKDMKERYV